jgi:hypothetical protein
MKPGTKWLIAIIGLLVLNAVAATVLIIEAHSHDRSTVLPSYKLEAR